MLRPRRMRQILLGLPALLAITLCSCADGHFTLLGYSTKPNYDPGIRTVRVPIFKNLTFRQGVEFELTQAVVREIEAKTPFKVVSANCPADTELTGTIVMMNKAILNRTQLNEVRDAETVLTVQIIWKDLRTGEVLSQPKSAQPAPGPLGAPPCPPVPVLVHSTAEFIPELGESIASAQKKNVDRLAVQIVSMMEKPW